MKTVLIGTAILLSLAATNADGQVYQPTNCVKKWKHSEAGSPFRSYSPAKLANSKPHWALAGDSLLWNAAANRWMNPSDASPSRPPLYDNIPPHAIGAPKPAGGNEVFADGSAA
jgi:hypothetical protein